MEKEIKSLGKLSPEENERLVDELESEMRKDGAVYEVDSREVRLTWYKRLLQRIKNCLGLTSVITVMTMAMTSEIMQAGNWQIEMDNFDPNRWQGETMVNATVYSGVKPVSHCYLMAEIDGELRGFVKEPQCMVHEGISHR